MHIVLSKVVFVNNNTGFTLQNFLPENQLKRKQYLLKQCKGRLKLAPKYHQKYQIDKDISSNELRQYN